MNQRSEILFQADKAGYAIPAFNYSDIWELLAIVQVAREERAPVYVSSDMIVVEALGITMTGALGRQLYEDRHHAVVNHLDHSNSTSLCRLAIDNGYPSVMIDASLLPVEENIKKVKSVVDYAHPRNVIVEGEIGRIMGKNTEISYEGKEYLAKIEDVINMVETTKVDSLAVGLGNAHGFYAKNPQIDFERLEEINAVVDVPLVLHGGTGIPFDDVARCIELGVSKVNVGTLLHSAYLKELRVQLAEKEDEYNLAEIYRPVMGAVKDAAREWIHVCRADGRLSD